MNNRYIFLDTVGGIMLLHMMFIVHAARITNIFPSFVEYLMSLLTCFLPWFFFKSGMFYRNKDIFKGLLYKRARTLLLPFAVFSFFGWFLIYLLGSIFFTDDSIRDLLTNSVATFIWEGAFNGNFALWFLLSLFWVTTVYRLLRMMKFNNFYILLLSFACAYGINKFEMSIPTYIGNVCNGMFFYSLGVALRQKQFDNSIFTISIIVFVISAIFPSYLDFRANEVVFGNKSYLLAELYCFVGIIFFNNIFYRYFPNPVPLLTHVGRNSMKYYVVHYIFLIGLYRIITMVFHLSNPIVLFLLVVPTMSILLYISGIILSKEPYVVLMGQRCHK